MKKFKEETIKKRMSIKNENKDMKEIQKQKLIDNIKEESRNMLLPNMKEKVEKTANLIIQTLKEKDLNNIQIMSMLARGSLLEFALAGGMSYSATELRIGFDLYLEMIGKINEVKPFPPTVESFANFMGISRETYNNYLVDPEKRDVMNFIHSYLLGVLATSSLTGEVKEVSSIFLQKTMGKIEETQPVIIEHKKVTDIDEIQAKLASLRKNNIIEANYEEK